MPIYTSSCSEGDTDFSYTEKAFVILLPQVYLLMRYFKLYILIFPLGYSPIGNGGRSKNFHYSYEKKFN